MIQKLRLNNKAQSLPLNTIVIALLVVIVLVVIVLAFTSNIGSANDTIADNAASNKCSTQNTAIAALGYSEAKYSDPDDSCDEGFSSLPGFSEEEDGKTKLCCVKRR